ncbi:uncharacterized protein LOC132903887 [Amyelois transitella]|uniref:uncharacterized protein LOC106134947 n=1 Tax=Amyelois transitella TaxID=680683 RepID=UPI00067CF03D|nr:uncharacterized protein LOC106134947 [Amyelois transitella]XP_060809329.1 uncharacterized protein LOC132903887 [Amyelois transitella]
MSKSNETENFERENKGDGDGDGSAGSVGTQIGIGLWRYFKKSDKGGKCLMCSDELKISQRSTKGLKIHLKTKHNIDINSRNDETGEKSLPVIPKKKPKTLDSFVIKENSMDKTISRMVCKDGFTLSSFCTSSDLRDLFSKSGNKLPNSPNTIRSIVTNFSNTVKADMIIEFERLKKGKQRFSLTFDEWTSQKNHRYLNINVHQKENHFNLGLVRIQGSATAEHCISLVKERLASFGLDLDTDIIACTTDGASVMVKVGKLLRCSQQLCFTHGLQLVVVDTLYKKSNSPIPECPAASIATESDNDDDDDMDANEQGVTVNINSPPLEMTSTYDNLLKKVRKVVKIFKRSPTKNDVFLQKYVKEQEGPKKELALILDCRTRWNSLLNMLERFYNLKNCIDKALIDIESEIKFSDNEWFKINDLIASLQPFKLGVEALCRRESTLITADTTFQFILDKLQQKNTVLSNQLTQSLHERIKERRTNLTGVLIYLQNPKKYDQEAKNTDRTQTFFMPKKAAIRQEIKKILERVSTVEDDEMYAGDVFENTSIAGTSVTVTDTASTLTLKEELEKQLQQEKEIFKKRPDNKQKDYEKILKKEMACFESDGIRGEYLTLAYEYIMTVQPTSVEAERAFSASGYICSSLRSRLGDDTINAICFLRAYFQKSQS